VKDKLQHTSCKYYVQSTARYLISLVWKKQINTLWTGDADLRLYITTMQDG